jgi:hypothetical protein
MTEFLRQLPWCALCLTVTKQNCNHATNYYVCKFFGIIYSYTYICMWRLRSHHRSVVQARKHRALALTRLLLRCKLFCSYYVTYLLRMYVYGVGEEEKKKKKERKKNSILSRNAQTARRNQEKKHLRFRPELRGDGSSQRTRKKKV